MTTPRYLSVFFTRIRLELIELHDSPSKELTFCNQEHFSFHIAIGVGCIPLVTQRSYVLLGDIL